MSVIEVFHRKLRTFNINIENWELCPKGITALWGPSGSGKSTILKGLTGLDPKSQVVWKWGDQDLAQIPIGQRRLGVLFQDLALFPHLSVKDNILFPVQKNIHTQWKKDFQHLCECLEISHLLKHSVHQLSGGEAQRVALTRALILRPRMLLLDEPFASLDEHLRDSARQMVKVLNHEWSCPILLITHDREDVKHLAHKVSYLSQGRIEVS